MRYLDVIQESLDYIEDNLKTEITAEELARRAGFSLYHYYRLFQQVVGLSVKQYIVWRRLLGVAYKISNGKKQVEAALEYGFETSAGLYKAFRKMFGYSPSEYVKRFRVVKPYRINLLQEKYIMIGHNRIKEVMENWNIEVASITNKVYSTNGEINPNVFVVNENYVLKVFQVLGQAKQNAQIQRALQKAGLQEILPIETKLGEEIVTDGQLYYILLPFVDGEEMKAADLYEGDTYHKAFDLGKVIGKLHLALKENDDILCNKRNIFKEVCEKWLQMAANKVGLSEQFCDDYINTFGSLHQQLPVQIIHRDPNPSNFIFKEGQCVGVVDFDLAQCSIRLFDPCYAATGILSESFEKQGERWFDIFQGLLHGYDRIVQLTEEEKQAVPYVVMSIQLICVGFFSTQEKFERLAETNTAMLKWLLKNREKLDYFDFSC